MDSILKKRSGSGQGGFTLVEVLMAVFITGIIAIGVYSVYNTFYRQSDRQDKALEAQQNARVALGLMERELVNAGYAAGTADIITEATATSLEFIYSDPSTDPTESPTAGNRLQVRYGLQTTGGVQYLVRKANNLSTGTVGSTDDVIPYVQNVTLTYYDIDGNVIADTTTQPNRNTVKFVSLKIVAQSKPEPGRNPKIFTVETHIRLRNIGIGQTSLDTTPPAAPMGIQVRDPGQCERLKVKWTENTEGDVMGYQLFYGTSSGAYTGIINIPLTVLSSTNYSCSKVSGTIECTIFPTNPVFAYTPSNSVAGTTYYVAVEAYDNSLNRSAFSAEVSGDPSPSSPVFDAGGNDSTINPIKPVAVTGFTGADGPTDGAVTLNWSAYDLTSSPDVKGFRVYRSQSPFPSYPIDPNLAGIDWIAGEPGSGKPEIAKAETTFTDSGPNLVGCRKYYYAIAPVNCDPTLITDDGGDPASKMYIASDYAITYGDGAGIEVDSPGGADTAPPDTAIPSPPAAFDARAGWKRVAISLTQPADLDLYQTCLYSNQGAAYPSLLGSKDLLGCFDVSTGIRLFESDGVFTTAEVPISGSTSFWHNSMTVLTSSPNLAETGVYSYTAVSFDLCGNGSPASSAQATTTLCGEDPPVLPDVDATGYGQPAPGKPPAVTGVTGAGCGGNPEDVDLAWTGVSSNIAVKSTEFNPYDLAGYRIFRGIDSIDWSGATLLTTTAPFWGTGYSDVDAALVDGGPYYYRVVSTDCPYEKNNPSEATIRADMNSNYLRYAQYGPIYPGKISRDEKCTGAGSCTKDAHREILTGVTLNSSNTPTPSTSFYHNTVTLFFENTSGSTMTIQGASVSWVNSSALLREVKIGGGRGGVGLTSTSIGSGSTTPVIGNPPYTSAVANIALTPAQIPALARYVPITFEFKDSLGTKNVDMREDQLLITLNVQNDSTGTTTCRSYMTVSLSQEGVIVSYGPSISATQQDKPASPTFGYAVPGPTGLNTVPSGSNGSIVVDAGSTVTVSASIDGLTTNPVTGAKVPVTSATLYYVATLKTVTVAPTSGYTSVAMTNPSGNTWRGTIPSNDNKRVWYYIVANDGDGNFDRDPEIEHGAYVYDQKSFSICDVTPATPTNFVALNPTFDFTVDLSWTAVTTYTGGAPLDASDSITYRIFRNGTQIVASQAGTTYTDTVPSSGIYTYTVMARNACASPSPKESAVATTAACGGSSASATLTVSPTSIFRGESYTVNIVDCYALTGPTGLYYTSQETINLTSGFTGFTNTSTGGGSYGPQITETGPATATFNTTITTTSNPADPAKLLTLASDTVTVTYPYATPSTRTVSVVVDPCTNTPKAPTGLTGSVSGQNMTINWTAVTQNTDNSAITDLAGYRVYEKVCAKNKPNCTGADIVTDWFQRTSAASGTTTATVNADNGAINQRIYYFKVTAIDSCSTVKESGYSNEWSETN